MRSRLSLFFDDLALEELLYLEEELDRRKEKYRRNYAVLAVQADRPVLRTENMAEIERFHRDMRRFISGNAAVGGGTLLYFSPEQSILLFNGVSGASRTCSALLCGLPELHGQYANPAFRIGLRLGLATGYDTLAPGSPRSLRSSPLVRRASQSARRGSSGTVLMDENSYHEWPDKLAAELVPIEIEGQHVYRAIPGTIGRTKANYDDDSLLAFFRQVAGAGISMLKYDLERIEHDPTDNKIPQDAVRIVFQAYDPNSSQNLVFKEVISISDYGDRIESVKRMLSSMGLALVRHEASVAMGV
jgi:hypothetical protein